MFGEMSVFTIGFAIQDYQTSPRQNQMHFVDQGSGILTYPILSRLWTEGFYHCEISLLIYTDDIERKFCSNFRV